MNNSHVCLITILLPVFVGDVDSFSRRVHLRLVSARSVNRLPFL